MVRRSLLLKEQIPLYLGFQVRPNERLRLFHRFLNLTGITLGDLFELVSFRNVMLDIKLDTLCGRLLSAFDARPGWARSFASPSSPKYRSNGSSPIHSRSASGVKTRS